MPDDKVAGKVERFSQAMLASHPLHQILTRDQRLLMDASSRASASSLKNCKHSIAINALSVISRRTVVRLLLRVLRHKAAQRGQKWLSPGASYCRLLILGKCRGVAAAINGLRVSGTQIQTYSLPEKEYEVSQCRI